MATTRKRRPYDGTSRRKSADKTVRSILDAARKLFLQRGYIATTMPAIAQAAGIALDTVYAAVGRKPKLLGLLIEGAISGTEEPIPAEQRLYVRAIRAETDAVKKLRIYAAALCSIHPRLAPMLRILQMAVPLDAELAALWREISDRRASNMLLFAEDLLATGQVRADLSAQQIADIVWSTGSPEFYLLLVGERGWGIEAFEHWLRDTWVRLLLRDPRRKGR
jgi:AcrR family transcriptional regulator